MRIDRRSLVIGGAALGAIGYASPGRADVASEKAAIESGLRLAVDAENRPPVRMNILDRMARYGVPGASVAVMRRGRLVWSGAYGVRRAGSDHHVTPQTIFQAASLSKPLTAFGALRMMDAGKIGLQDDVNERLRSWRIPFAANVPRVPITLEHLLSHMAGVNVPSFPGFKHGETLPSLSAILQGAPEAKTPRIEVSEPPGPLRYSGGGYMVVEQLIEDLTRTSFNTYMRASVLDPLRMQTSTFDTNPRAQLARDLAAGHSWTGRLRDEDWLLYPQHAAASLWSTAEDLVRFLSAVVAVHQNAPGALLKGTAARETQKFVDGVADLALGAHMAEENLIAHAGWNTGYRSYIAAFPDTGDGIAVMTNGDRGNDLAMEIVRSAARTYGWPKFDSVPMDAVALSNQTFAAIAGTYDFPEAGIQVTAARDRDHLKLTTPRGDWTFQPVGDRWPQNVTLYCIEDTELATIQTNKGQLELLVWGMTGHRGP